MLALADNAILLAADRMVASDHPEEIILFGSAALGTMTQDSDIDFLVVGRGELNSREESQRLRKAIGDVGFAVDVVVMTRQRFADTRNIIGGLAYVASRFGRNIYMAPDPTTPTTTENATSVRQRFVSQLLAEGDEHLAATRYLEDAPGARFERLAAFHNHQAAEDSIKALLVHHQIDHSSTIHDIQQLLDLLSSADGASRAG